jgi:hypothetical protein
MLEAIYRPVGLQQPGGGCRKAAAFAADLMAAHPAHARDHHRLVDIQTSNALVDDIHRFPPHHRRRRGDLIQAGQPCSPVLNSQ